jgi:hypothetical protein
MVGMMTLEAYRYVSLLSCGSYQRLSQRSTDVHILKKWVIRLRRSSWRGNQQFKWEFRSVDFFLPSDYSLSTGYFSGIKAQQKWMYNIVCLGGRTWLTHHCWQPNTVAIPLSRDTWWVIELWASSFPLKGRGQRGFYLKYVWKNPPKWCRAIWMLASSWVPENSWRTQCTMKPRNNVTFVHRSLWRYMEGGLQTVPGAHPASYTMGTWSISRG